MTNIADQDFQNQLVILGALILDVQLDKQRLSPSQAPVVWQPKPLPSFDNLGYLSIFLDNLTLNR